MQALAERVEAALGARCSTARRPRFSALKTVVPAPEALVGPALQVGRSAREVRRARLRRRRAHPRAPLAGRSARPRVHRPRRRGGRVRSCGSGSTATAPCSCASTATSARPRGGCSRPTTTGRSSSSARSPTPTRSPSSCSHGTDKRRIHTWLRDQRTVAGHRSRLRRRRAAPRAGLAVRDARRRSSEERPPPARRDPSDARRRRSRASARAWRARRAPKLGDRFAVHGRAGTPCPVCGDDAAPRLVRVVRDHVLPDVPDRRQGPRRPSHVPPRQVAHQPRVPGPPLNGPTTSLVIQPP